MRRDLSRLKSPTVIRRADVQRRVKLEVRGQSATAALGKLEPGCEIFGFTKGQFSLIDLFDAILRQTGPADVSLSTWTAARSDVTRARGWLRSDLVRSMRFIVDYSFQSRQPDFCEVLRSAFGDDAIRVTVTHAKFALIRNDDWSIVVRTSMNLNFNPRFENFEVSADPVLAEFMQMIVDEIWASQSAGEGFTNAPAANKEQWRGTFSSLEDIGANLTPAADALHLVSTPSRPAIPEQGIPSCATGSH